MNEHAITMWLPPILTLLGTLIVVTSTAWLNFRAVLGNIEAVKRSVEALRHENASRH